MLSFMDWSVVALGCGLVLAGLGGWWWDRAKVQKGAGPDQGRRFFSAWLPLLMGAEMIGAKVPGLLHAPHPVLMIVAALNFALMFTVALLAFWMLWRRSHHDLG
ncbi:hypothetical protein [Streptomyces sp. BV129]|uniref:hypothetical protein n=1 Tax=Streptomyces sp. BV129 TaxID=2849671 RepID=UPI001C2F0A0D|nr:hypothetical protein [Streptomyces sp. BV129]MBV1949627.1 hypothetical protein [Streptomyces sp. BV129]